MSAPRISVVVPTMGRRPQRLAALLEALAGQDLPDGDLEVVLGCDPGVELPAAPSGLAARVERAAERKGAAGKRNLAWRAARAPLVAFTDDDCRPAPGWAHSLLTAWEASPSAFLQGRTDPDPQEDGDRWGFAQWVTIVGDSPWHETCNIAYPRALLEQLGGFEETYGLLGGEDTDLGWRAVAAGASKAYVEDALVWHAVEQRSFRAAIREAARTRDQPQLLARFPFLRRELTLGLFHRNEHARLLLLLAGALTRRRLLAAIAAVPFLEGHLRRYSLSPPSLVRAATHLPVRILVNAIEMCVIASRGLRRGVIAL